MKKIIIFALLILFSLKSFSYQIDLAPVDSVLPEVESNVRIPFVDKPYQAAEKPCLECESKHVNVDSGPVLDHFSIICGPGSENMEEFESSACEDLRNANARSVDGR